ncbi:hypothetical protein MCOR02_005537 [Pyricularia oryzae]|nr:hypothetical protein MCOR02_005537 [Pyricularia oryzae]KAI6252480.1 hypothetical protein MCOR19_010912 [Pyricularia oryzae]KAI6267454.1 hypothetical protein MCOR34_011786 [Pyricularia oryzae]KAI6358338.1 hypothetical protein MCOR31_009923 [Pyricularia oryzae]KAI6391032.1 hypothetical protein MCOR20_011452 [Pyricularia oryzae]
MTTKPNRPRGSSIVYPALGITEMMPESSENGDRQEPGVETPLLGDRASSPNGNHDSTGGFGGAVSQEHDAEARPVAFVHKFGAKEAFAIIVSIVVGSGIFTSPGAIDANVPSPGVALSVWLVGGLLAWTGASTLAELGTAIPGEGGVQAYLSYIFGDLFGHLAAWTWIFGVMPVTLAILCIVFISNILAAFNLSNTHSSDITKIFAFLLATVTCASTLLGAARINKLNSFFVAIKLFTVTLVVTAALTVVIAVLIEPSKNETVGGRDWRERNWFAIRNSPSTEWDQLGTWEVAGRFSAALYAALWGYCGWDKAVYVSPDLKNPSKQLPKAINTALPTIILCFVAANAAYYVLLPWVVVPTSDTVAVDAFSRLLGPWAGFASTVLVCTIILGSLVGNTFITIKMTLAAANRGYLPQACGGIEGEDPVVATVMALVLSAVYIAGGSFRFLVLFNGLAEYSFFFLAAVGALILRKREPDLERPYKTSIAGPVVFAVVSGFVVVRGAIFAPVQAVCLVVLWGISAVVRLYWTHQ